MKYSKKKYFMAWSVITLFVAVIAFLSWLNAKYLITRGGLIGNIDLCIVIVVLVSCLLFGWYISNRKNKK